MLITSMCESKGQATLGPCSPDCLSELRVFRSLSPPVGSSAGWVGFRDGQWV